MSDDMKKVLTMLAALTTQVGELKEELAALKKQPKPTPVKEEKPDTSFAGLYGSHLTNPDGSGKKLKHTADTKDGGEDDWYGVWDAKNKVIKRINEDGSETDEVYESFGDFGTAHYKSLGEQNKKKLAHDSNGGWDKVKVLDSVKRKFFSANTLLPMGEKPRSQSRAKSASRKSNAAAAAAGGGGGGELNIAKPKNSRRKPQPSPKEVAQAAAVLVVAAAAPEPKKRVPFCENANPKHSVDVYMNCWKKNECEACEDALKWAHNGMLESGIHDMCEWAKEHWGASCEDCEEDDE